MEDPELDRPEETPLREMKTPQGKTSILRHPVWGRVAFYGGLLFLFGILTVVGELRDRQRRERIRLVQVTLNLELIGEALIQYQAEHGTFPPAYIADEAGRPMHSWRVLILPYLDDEWLYERYDFEKPWDDPENLKLLETIPYCYRNFWDVARDKPPMTTPILAISAAGTILGTTEGSRLDDIAEPTVMVIEAKDHLVPWTKPEDISPAEIIARLHQFKRHSPSGFHVLMSDGSVNIIDDEITVEELGKSF